MRTWLNLLRREWWEHRSGFLWTPVATAALVILASALALSLVSGTDTQFSYSTQQQSGANSASDAFEWRGSLLQMLDFSSWSASVLSERAAQFRALIAQPFVLGHFLVAVFVLLGGLHDDRRDRSVLFWKSMPVSDLETVTSKLVFAVWVAPLVAIAAILTAQAGSLLLLTLLGPAAGVTGIELAWHHAGLLSWRRPASQRLSGAGVVGPARLRLAAAGIRGGTPCALRLGAAAARCRGCVGRLVFQNQRAFRSDPGASVFPCPAPA